MTEAKRAPGAVQVAVWSTVLIMTARAVQADPAPTGLHLRRHTGSGWSDQSIPIPAKAVRVFTYEGSPRSVRVTGKHIAADYGVSAVLYNAADGTFVRRVTLAEGWPRKKPPALDASPAHGRKGFGLEDPGVVTSRRTHRTPGMTGGDGKTPLQVAAEATLGGRTFRAMQPALFDLRRGVDWSDVRKEFGHWGAYLERSGKLSCVLALGEGEAKTRRYTTADGLAGNIVSRLVVSEGVLWAVCVDVYDTKAKAWGPGGLCRYDPKTDRWVRAKTAAGQPVRWVTLLVPVGKDLWVGCRTGEGLVGEKISYGMGVYPGMYRPKVKSIVLARLRAGSWSAWSRPPMPEASDRPTPRATARVEQPSTEVPRELAVLGEKVLLYSTVQGLRASGNFRLPVDGRVSVLDLANGQWQTMAIGKDIPARWLAGMHAEAGQVLLTSMTGLLRWDAAASRFQRLDSGAALPNASIRQLTPVGEAVWIGFGRQGFRMYGRQGIGRYSETTGTWTWMSPKQLGTSCHVQTIAAEGGHVWVLFQPEQWIMAASLPTMMDRIGPGEVEAEIGLGLWEGGTWTFPAKLEGVPESVELSRRGPNGVETWKRPAPIGRLAVVDGAVFVSNRAGVYQGPKPWKRIYDKPTMGMAPAPDGKGLWLIGYDPNRRGVEETKYEIGRYIPTTGALTWRAAKRGELGDFPYAWGTRFLRRKGFPDGCARVKTKKEGDWHIWPVPSGMQRVVTTRRAIWIALLGQLVRIDRSGLPDWVEPQP